MAGKTLTIVLAADISRLSKGLRSAQGDLDTFDGRVNSLGSKISSSLGPAAISAAAAVGTLAVAIGVQGVQAAIAEESANAKLAKTLENLGFESATKQVQGFIETQMRATGVADDILRPAYDRLIRATHDIGAANDALTLSMDISAGTGASLQQVTNALGKAFEGNFGALSKLGTGIDKATLATGDMNLITAKLAQTFGGQAATQAETFGGQLQQLKTAGDELAEAFGKGVVDAFTKTVKGSGDLTDNLYKLQTTAEDLGTAIGTAGGDLLIAIGYVLDAKKAFTDLTQQGGILGAMFTGLGDALGGFGNPLGVLIGSIQKIRDAWNLLTGAEAEANVGTGDASKAYGRTAEELSRFNTALGLATVNWDALTPAVVTNTGATTAASAAQKIANDALDAQNKILDASKTKLSTQTDALKAAGQAYVDYWQNLQGKISSGIDLGAAFDISQTTGQSLTDALGSQIADMDWYGTVLTNLQASGASQALLDAITEAGPGIGAKLGEKILLEGLIPTLNAQLEYVKSSSELTAKAMVPAFLIEGQNAAIGFVQEAATQVLKDQEKLKKIGKNLGQPVALQAAQEIAVTLAKAWKDIEAAKTAADAAAAAAGSSRRVVVSDQQAIQQLSQILANGNARAGYQDTVVIA